MNGWNTRTECVKMLGIENPYGDAAYAGLWHLYSGDKSTYTTPRLGGRLAYRPV